MSNANSNKWLALLGISLASFLGCIDFTIVNTALPSIQAELDASMTQLQWIINGFMLVLAACMVVAGRLADIYGRRRLLYIGMFLFAISSLAAGFAPNVHWLIAFRFIQGLGVAILYTAPVAIISDMFPEEQRGKALGILFGANGLGLAIGPVIGGLILGVLSWRWIFFVNPPIIIISVLFCLKTLRESKSHDHGKTIDWPGFILLAFSMPALIIATVEGSNWGWTSPLTLGTYALAVIALIAFYFIEHRTKSPIIQFHLFVNKLFFSGIVANIALAFFYTVAFFLMPLYLHNVQGYTGFEIGLMLLPATMMVALLSPVVGHLLAKTGPFKLMLCGFFLFAVSAYLQTYFAADTAIWYIVVAFVLFGTGWAFILTPSFTAAISSVPQSVSGVAMGTLGTLHNFGGAIGLAIGTVIYHYQAKSVLVHDAVQKGIAVKPWMDQVVADPDNAKNIILQHTSMNTQSATDLFQHSFLSGYHGAMWLLLGISLAAFAISAFGLWERKAT